MIYVVIEGGCVQSVCSDDPKDIGKQLQIIDYDTDGVDDSVLTDIKQDDGSISQAQILEFEIELLAVRVQS